MKTFLIIFALAFAFASSNAKSSTIEESMMIFKAKVGSTWDATKEKTSEVLKSTNEMASKTWEATRKAIVGDEHNLTSFEIETIEKVSKDLIDTRARIEIGQDSVTMHLNALRMKYSDHIIRLMSLQMKLEKLLEKKRGDEDLVKINNELDRVKNLITAYKWSYKQIDYIEGEFERIKEGDMNLLVHR